MDNDFLIVLGVASGVTLTFACVFFSCNYIFNIINGDDYYNNEVVNEIYNNNRRVRFRSPAESFESQP